jgi:hypothetical protein
MLLNKPTKNVNSFYKDLSEIQTKTVVVCIVDPKNSKPVKFKYKICEIQAIKTRFFVWISPIFCLDFPDFRKNMGNPNLRTAKSKQ